MNRICRLQLEHSGIFYHRMDNITEMEKFCSVLDHSQENDPFLRNFVQNKRKTLNALTL